MMGGEKEIAYKQENLPQLCWHVHGHWHQHRHYNGWQGVIAAAESFIGRMLLSNVLSVVVKRQVF